MPILKSSTYDPLIPFRSGHINTIFPALFRQIPDIRYKRERIDTPDGDFLDLDWSASGGKRLAFVLHGLEGNAGKPYVKGMIRKFNRQGWDGLAINFRSCSGEMNRKLRVYHSGETEDLRFVLNYIIEKEIYSEIALIGFSMGGNILLKYLGEQGPNTPPVIKRAVAFSAPCDLASSSKALHARGMNQVYLRRFMRLLNKKLMAKMAQYPHALSLPKGRLPRNFLEFDDWFTAPLHGFQGAEDYWERASSKPLLSRITRPTLIVNAQNDSFLGEACYPGEIAMDHPFLYLEVPAHGGHVGFFQPGNEGVYWSEQRAWEFVAGDPAGN